LAAFAILIYHPVAMIANWIHTKAVKPDPIKAAPEDPQDAAIAVEFGTHASLPGMSHVFQLDATQTATTFHHLIRMPPTTAHG
jgi:hypothetical protein